MGLCHLPCPIHPSSLIQATSTRSERPNGQNDSSASPPFLLMKEERVRWATLGMLQTLLRTLPKSPLIPFGKRPAQLGHGRHVQPCFLLLVFVPMPHPLISLSHFRYQQKERIDSIHSIPSPSSSHPYSHIIQIEHRFFHAWMSMYTQTFDKPCAISFLLVSISRGHRKMHTKMVRHHPLDLSLRWFMVSPYSLFRLLIAILFS